MLPISLGESQKLGGGENMVYSARRRPIEAGKRSGKSKHSYIIYTCFVTNLMCENERILVLVMYNAHYRVNLRWTMTHQGGVNDSSTVSTMETGHKHWPYESQDSETNLT